MTGEQRKFNSVHAKTRQVIERAFALLVGRFRRLKHLQMKKQALIPPTIIAACVLHNICLSHWKVVKMETENCMELFSNYINLFQGCVIVIVIKTK